MTAATFIPSGEKTGRCWLLPSLKSCRRFLPSRSISHTLLPDARLRVAHLERQKRADLAHQKPVPRLLIQGLLIEVRRHLEAPGLKAGPRLLHRLLQLLLHVAAEALVKLHDRFVRRLPAQEPGLDPAAFASDGHRPTKLARPVKVGHEQRKVEADGGGHGK